MTAPIRPPSQACQLKAMIVRRSFVPSPTTAPLFSAPFITNIAKLHRCQIACRSYRLHPVLASTSQHPQTAKQQRLASAADAVRARLEPCVLAEADAQREQLEKAYNKASDRALVREGIALLSLQATPRGRLYGDIVWQMAPAEAGATFPQHRFKPGTSAVIRRMGGARRKGESDGNSSSGRGDASSSPPPGLDAIVMETGSSRLLLTVSSQVAGALAQSPPGMLFRLEQGVQSVTTERQLAALAALSALDEDAPQQEWAMRAILVGSPRAPKLAETLPRWMDSQEVRQRAGAILRQVDSVNDSQRAAIAAALTRTLTLWQGPPGTGKTRTLVSFLAVLCSTLPPATFRQQVGPILAVAETNAAADNMLEGLARQNVRAVRMSRPAQVRPDLRGYCLDALAERSKGGQQASALRDQAAITMARIAAAVAAEKITSREAKVAQRDVDRLWASADAQLAEAAQKVLELCQVVVGTCASAGEARLAARKFRVVVVDEASQATEPSTLVALVKGAECVVMAGDQAQLPPTILSQTAIENGLDITLFNTLQKRGMPDLILNTQYRMHPGIAEFPSRRFYAGRIKTGVAAEDRSLPRGCAWPNPQVPVAFIPCSSPEERSTSGPLAAAEGSGTSFRNPGQTDAALSILHAALSDASVQTVAVLTPYNGQVRVLISQLKEEAPEALEAGRLIVSTVDGFQGREADVVVFVTVRCNPGRVLGFVSDPRRMNVAITRARRGLVVVGCPRTLSTSPDWSAWLGWVRDNAGVVQTGWICQSPIRQRKPE